MKDEVSSTDIEKVIEDQEKREKDQKDDFKLEMRIERAKQKTEKAIKKARKKQIMLSDPDKVNPYYLAVVDEYLKNGRNKVRAYMKVYPNATYTTAQHRSNIVFKDPDVVDILNEVGKIELERLVLNELEIKEQLSKIGTGQIKDEYTTYDEDGCVKERKTAAKVSDQVRALELLGKTTGMYVDNTNLTGDLQPVMFVNDIPKDDKN